MTMMAYMYAGRRSSCRTRSWDGLDGLEKGYQLETTSSPSGVTHLALTRVGV